ncbi:hypothetical protein ACIJYF_00805 [Candidatus Pelagibacter bacterium nBUS_49]|uniref:hypothetical protein n=1 Tax=Candidatus Pelagibacter bacterium nBUS_49 TaxID=3374196 RepID=UPI003EB840F3
MKIIFICTKSITFNTFLKSQANFFSRRGLKVEVACSDIENLEFKNKIKHRIDFPLRVTDFFKIKKYIKIFFQIKKIKKKIVQQYFIFIHQ